MSDQNSPAAAPEETPQQAETASGLARKDLPPAAQRALAEAEERRVAALEAERNRPKEYGGRDGLDPARYGDWEKKGIAVDF